MTRRVGIFKRIDLSGLADGWDDCFVLVKPLTYGMLSQLTALDAKEISEKEAIETTTRLVKENIVGGQVKVMDESGNLASETFQSEDVDSMSVEMVNHIMAEMTGQGAQYSDPKESATPTSDEESPSTSKDSETTSSAD